MQDDVTRRKVFWLLQRLTSLSLWRAKQRAFKVFASAYETAARTWPSTDPVPLSADHLTTIYTILDLYDQGLNELANGHRFVWRQGQPLALAIREFNSLASHFYRHPDYWDRGSQVAPYPPRIDALVSLLRASEYRMEQAPVEVWDTDHNFSQLQSVSALLNPSKYNYRFYDLAYPVFPDVLPEVPNPSGPVIQSGGNVPFDGIWETVSVEQTRVLGAIPPGVKLFRNNGCFNYFVKDTAAPNLMAADPMTSDVVAKPVHWRLLWEDTRYQDGAIPDESQYFLASPA
ncbi:hypothetical protein G3N95_24845 [Paraburkholderia sp. Tr-20389]|uniref:Imm72 family immunity protein n=1 Tax=Paraburkholderia sp. Tr-20389 TaxID=2703903 RepID=UPI00197FF066|nr:Imm72 family immunity protein [Paraburkholderia sp. Tr-20389]MBN3756191.1 hypothetical protein [Paraburkholderia sp. Tr-20389]